MEHPLLAVDEGLAAAAHRVEDLDQRIVEVRLDLPVETAGALGDALEVDDIDPAGLRLGAVEGEIGTDFIASARNTVARIVLFLADFVD